MTAIKNTATSIKNLKAMATNATTKVIGTKACTVGACTIIFVRYLFDF